MGTWTTARYILSAVLGLWIGACTQAQDIVEVEPRCPEPDSVLEHGTQREIAEHFPILIYSCHRGFLLVGSPNQTCGPDGRWNPPQRPQCVPATPVTSNPKECPSKLSIENADVMTEDRSKGQVICRPGFRTASDRKTSYPIVCNKYGHWVTIDGERFPRCIKVTCPMPLNVPNAQYSYEAREGEGEEQQVRYTCDKDYELVDRDVEPVMYCRNGEWQGPTPTCVRFERCNPPRNILNGHWTLKTLGQYTLNTPASAEGLFPVESEVEYNCQPGFTLHGAQVIKCTADRSWSSVPPACFPASESNENCRTSGLDKMDNGYCKCEHSRSSNLEKCQPFRRGTQVRCFCDRGYKLQGSSLLTCTSLGRVVRGEYGTWDHEPPYCIREDSREVLPPSRRGNSLPSRVVNGTRVSTLVIVIATACSVLGVLLLIMVVVVFRRKKPRPRLFHPSVTPPPYSRVHNNMIDEQDRLALMAYADATRVHLPTYEEALQGGGGGAGGEVIGGRGGGSRNVVPPLPHLVGDYRPLPSIPPNLRAPGSVPGGGSDNPNRHSTVTTSTMNRDGLSENFGSLDTVNVSMSDASTSVTVETFDSGTSNRSMSSQRAAAGSIASSEDNLANDNAPLLDNSGEMCEDNCSVRSTPNLEHKEE